MPLLFASTEDRFSQMEDHIDLHHYNVSFLNKTVFHVAKFDVNDHKNTHICYIWVLRSTFRHSKTLFLLIRTLVLRDISVCDTAYQDKVCN